MTIVPREEGPFAGTEKRFSRMHAGAAKEDEAFWESSVEKLMSPLVPALRRKVKEFRDGGYVGATDTRPAPSDAADSFTQPHVLRRWDSWVAVGESVGRFRPCPVCKNYLESTNIRGGWDNTAS